MSYECVLTIDQGTSSTKIILFDTAGNPLDKSTQEIPLIENAHHYIEQDPDAILRSIQKGIQEVLEKSGVPSGAVVAVALDNQGETVIPFRKSDLKPLYNALSWQDGRGEERIRQIRGDAELTEYIKKITGLFPSSYFSASKMEWLIRNVEEISREQEKGNLVVATSEVWILNKLIDRTQFRTDYTTASRTMLFDIEQLKWDERLLELFHLDRKSIPEPVPTIGDFGITDPKICAGIKAPIVASVVDQQSALFGHRCFHEGEAKLTLGTGGFLQVHSGKDSKKRSDLIIKSLFPHVFNETAYIYEGQIYSVGSAIEWLKRNGFIVEFSEINEIEKSISKNVPFFIPALSGLAAPYWKSEPSAAFLGIGLQTTKTDLVRAVLESIAFRSVQIIRLIEAEAGIEMKSLSIDGGVSQNDFILRTISKLTRKRIVKPKNEDLTSLGGFFLASLKLGTMNSFDELLAYELDSLIIEESFDSSINKRFSEWENIFEKIVN
ncbi:MAG: hypothetical protein K9L29_12145 [Spirochaetales bacterium]|nr:hypothetical protein [Spirochaetales bacterium]